MQLQAYKDLMPKAAEVDKVDKASTKELDEAVTMVCMLAEQ
jgi:hypothetical protein